MVGALERMLLCLLLLCASPALAAPAGPRTEEPPLESRLVLRYKQMELRPDLKLYADWQASLTSGENAFHLTRAYLGLKVTLASWLSGRVTVDVAQASDLGQEGNAPVEGGSAEVPASRLDGSFVARLKYGYLEARLPLSIHLAAGMIHTPYIYWIEHIEGTRFLRKVLVEHEYHYPSADLGVAVFGHLRDYLDYAFGLYNGGGYHALETGKYKDLIGRVSIRPLPRHRRLGGLQLTGYLQAELPVPATEVTHRRYGGALTWRLAEEILSPDCRNVRGERLALWLQAFLSDEGPADALRRTLAVSGGGRLELPLGLGVLGRLDWFDADRRYTETATWRVLGAATIKLHEGLRLAIAYQGSYPPRAEREHLLGAHLDLGL
jgi:hypothetical protein